MNKGLIPRWGKRYGPGHPPECAVRALARVIKKLERLDGIEKTLDYMGCRGNIENSGSSPLGTQRATDLENTFGRQGTSAECSRL